MKLKIWEMSVLISLTAAVLFGAVTADRQAKLSREIVRLHVVADSDEPDAQELKLKVRDSVLEELEPIIAKAKNKSEAESLIAENLEGIANAASAVVAIEGESCAVKAELAREEFPTREYGTFALPAGNYTSLRVTLGSGEGHNWWCVVYPQLCKKAVIRDKNDAPGLTEGEVKLITGENGAYAVSFRTLELIQKIRDLFS